MTFMNGAEITAFTTNLAKPTPIRTTPGVVFSSLTLDGYYVRNILK